jgi:hypothetical protein
MLRWPTSDMVLQTIGAGQLTETVMVPVIRIRGPVWILVCVRRVDSSDFGMRTKDSLIWNGKLNLAAITLV